MRIATVILMFVLMLLVTALALGHPLPPGADPLPTDEPCPVGLCDENPLPTGEPCGPLCDITLTPEPTNEPCPAGLCPENPAPEGTPCGPLCGTEPTPTPEYQPLPIDEVHSITLTADYILYDAPNGNMILGPDGEPMTVWAGDEHHALAEHQEWVAIHVGGNHPVWILP
jgi:hypothetical protein